MCGQSACNRHHGQGTKAEDEDHQSHTGAVEPQTRGEFRDFRGPATENITVHQKEKRNGNPLSGYNRRTRRRRIFSSGNLFHLSLSCGPLPHVKSSYLMPHRAQALLHPHHIRQP